MKNYCDLSINAPRRLAMLKRSAEELNARPHRANFDHAYTWRDVRYSGFHNWHANNCDLSEGRNEGKPIWYCHTGPAFNREQWADEVEGSYIDHRGWYVNDFGDLIRGFVVLLPHGKVLAGYYVSDNGERVYYPEIYDDVVDAARDADHFAERYAELEREHHEKFSAAKELEYQIETGTDRLRECLALRNNPCFTGLRDEAKRIIETIRRNTDELKTEYADFI